MPGTLNIRLISRGAWTDIPATLLGAGDEAAAAFDAAVGQATWTLMLQGDRDYAVAVETEDEAVSALLTARFDRSVFVQFPGHFMVRRRLSRLSPRVVASAPEAQPEATPAPGAGALDLTEGRAGAAPLWLQADGSFSAGVGPASDPGARREALVNAARWISTRRKTSFERLFAPSAFHPDVALRPERLTVEQGEGALAQARVALREQAVGGALARQDPDGAAQVRSAATTVLSHLIATSLRDPAFRALADQAAAEVFALVDAEGADPTARPALRAHAIGLLQLRAPALAPADRGRAKALLQTLVRAAPPYEELTGAWSFAMCSDPEFHEGECEILVRQYRFREVEVPADAPASPRSWLKYRAFEAPFRNKAGQPIRVFARAASPSDENSEMGQPYFTGLLINRHAQLGSFDMRAATIRVEQHGYKLMMNSQCAGLTTRFAIGRLFPDADIYSSWDSTYFRKDSTGHKVSASEGLDCFVALLQGMAAGEDHVSIGARMRKVQWHHPQASAVRGFSQFVGPGDPLVLARYSDVNQDGRADLYDGFLDFTLAEIAEDLRSSMTPRDPGVAASQISGEAANGLGWAAGSMNRVTQYSDLWAGLPGESEDLYAFSAGGFYSHIDQPGDVDSAPSDARRPGWLPALVRFERQGDGELRAEVQMHAWLSHSAKELKRLLVAAEALDRAIDLGVMSADASLRSREGRRGAVLLMLAGLLEFPSDQNMLDGLWSMALKALNLPELSRSVVRACITDADHDLSNYYGSRRGLKQLLESLERTDPLAWAKLSSEDPSVGRASELAL